MKFAALIFICVGLCNALEDQCQGPYVQTVHANCLAKVGGDKKLIDELIEVHRTSTETGKCFRACLYEDCNYFDEDDKLRPDTPQRIARLFYAGIDSHLKPIEEAGEKCLTLVDYNKPRCDFCEDYSQCIVEHSTVPLKLFGVYD